MHKAKDRGAGENTFKMNNTSQEDTVIIAKTQSQSWRLTGRMVAEACETGLS